MARPETHADLPEHRLRTAVATVHEVDLTQPRIMRAVAELVEAVQAAGGTMSRRYSAVELSMPTSEDELDTALRSAQSTWDTHERWWREATEKIAYPDKPYTRDAVDRWAKAEDRPAVDWPAEEVQC